MNAGDRERSQREEQTRHPLQSTMSYSPRSDGGSNGLPRESRLKQIVASGLDKSQRPKSIANTPANWCVEPARDGRASPPAVNGFEV
jgi:hypothetical protein